MNLRNRLADLAGTGKLVAYTIEGLPSSEYYATVKIVGSDFIEFNCLNTDLEPVGSNLVALRCLANVRIEPVYLERKRLERCLTLEAVEP